MDTIEVSQVCALALNNLPIVGRLIWCLTEGKHIVKLEITWQLPRTQTSWQTNQHRSTAKQPADGVTGGVIKMADKMVEKKMAAPTRKMEDELNVAVCSTCVHTVSSQGQGKINPDFSGAASMCLWCLAALKICKL